MSVCTELNELLVQLSLGRLDADRYARAHRQVVVRELGSWNQDPLLAPFAARLPYYCLDCDDPEDDLAPQRRVAELTFDFLLGATEREEYVRRLGLELAILDQLNSVPWAYALRSRDGSDLQSLTRLIPAQEPIDPGRRFARLFRTTVEGQEWARLELRIAHPGEERADACQLLLVRRLRLPGPLPKGHLVRVVLQRVHEACLRLVVEVPGCQETAGPWWRLEDDRGFDELVAAVAERPAWPARDHGEAGLRLLLDQALQALCQYEPNLADEESERLVDWIRHTSRAFAKGDGSGLESALRLLLEELQDQRDASVVFVLESLLTATGAPEPVMAEFHRRANELLFPRSEREVLLPELWTLVEQWRRHWEASDGARSTNERDGVGLLFALLDALKAVLQLPGPGSEPSGAKRIVYMRGIQELDRTVGKLLVYSRGLDPRYRSVLEEVRHGVAGGEPDRMLTGRSIAISASDVTFRDVTFRLDVPVHVLDEVIGLTLDRLFSEVAAPDELLARLHIVRQRLASSPELQEKARDELLAHVGRWYEQWQIESGPTTLEASPEVAILNDLLLAVDDPGATDAAVGKILGRRSLGSGALQKITGDLRLAKWFQAAPARTRDLVEEHLDVLDTLDRQWERVVSYHVDTLRDFLVHHREGLPVELQPLVRSLEALPREQVRSLLFQGETWPPTGDGLESREPPETCELLEAVPIEAEVELEAAAPVER